MPGKSHINAVLDPIAAPPRPVAGLGQVLIGVCVAGPYPLAR